MNMNFEVKMEMPKVTFPKLPNIAAMMESFTNGESEGGFMKSFQEAIRADAEAMAKAGAGNK